MPRLIALSLLGLLLALAVSVLYSMGLSGLEAQALRQEEDARELQVEELEKVRDEVERELAGLLERESARPFDHYRHLYLPADLVATNVALQVSPLASEPSEPLVEIYLEYREGEFQSPAFLSPDLAQEESPSPYADSIRTQLLTCAPMAPRLQQELKLRETVEPSPQIKQNVVDELVLQTNRSPETALASLEKALESDSANASLQEVWSGYQVRGYGGAEEGQGQDEFAEDRQSQKIEPYKARRSKGGSAGQGQQVQQQLAGLVPVRLHPFRYLSEGSDAHGWPVQLFAFRRVEAQGEAWLQGFQVDLQQLRSQVILPAITRNSSPLEARGSLGYGYSRRLKSSGAEPAVQLSPSRPPPAGVLLALPAPLESLTLVHRGRVDSGLVLSENRYLLDAALLLVIGVVIGGTIILVQASLAQRKLAQQRADFVAALTHELKAPLTGMRALAELLHEGIVTDESKRREYYASILTESERLTRLVQNVLDAARLERGRRLESVVGPLEVGPLLEELVERFRPRLSSEGFEVELQLAADLPCALADRESFNHVVANLLDNAAKYGRGEVRAITVSARAVDGELRVDVLDQGPGVPQTERRRVFERFYRSDQAPREVGGAGLGLAIARAQARAQGGELALLTSPGGAQFRLSLPLAPTATAGEPT